MIVVEDAEIVEIILAAAIATTQPCWSVGIATVNGPTYVLASSELGSANGSTAVTLITGEASRQKRMMMLVVFNRDTAAATVIIRRSATNIIFKALLVVGGTLHYGTETGFQVFDANGVLQYVGSTGPMGPPGVGDALTINPLSQFAATTSLQLKGVISDETGSGALVFGTSPTLVTPLLGMPASGNLNNCVLNWPSVKKVVPVGETAIIPADCQMTVKGPFLVNGTVLNSGEIFIN